MHTIKQQQVSRADLRALKRVLVAYNGAATVEQARELLVTGTAGVLCQILLAFAIFGALGLLFWPLALVAVPVAVALPFRAAADRRKWNELLPASRDEAALVLV